MLGRAAPSFRCAAHSAARIRVGVAQQHRRVPQIHSSQHRGLHASVARMGMFDGVKEKMSNFTEDRSKKAQDEQYQKHITMLLENKKFSLLDFKAQLDEMAEQGGATGWKSYIPGASKQAGMDQVKSQLRIMSAMEEHCMDELKGLTPLGRKSKLKIAEAAKVSVQDVNTLLEQHTMTQQLQDWMKKRKEAGLPLPGSMKEASDMAMTDRRFLKAPGRRTRQGRHMRGRK